MSTTNAPFGLRPVYHPSGLVRTYQLANGIASAYGTRIYQNQAVKLVTGGTIEAAAAGDSFVGSFQGCQYTDSTTSKRIITNSWPASAAYVAGSMVAVFTRDPEIIYEIQADGSVAQTAIGAMADLSNATAGNTTTGLSEETMSATIAAAGASAQLEIYDLAPLPDNAWGDTYTVVRVRINEHQERASVNGV
jgi:hypothetical protein